MQNLVPTQQLLRLLSSAALLLAGLVSSASASGPTVQDSMAQRTLACTACHGKEGRATSDGYYPRIAGKPAGYLYHQLLNFRDGRRHYGLMTQMVDLLSDDYLREIAEHYASIELPYPPPQPAAAPPAVLQRGQQLVQQGDTQRQLPACVQCHGSAMTGVAPNVPGLLGLPRDYLIAQLGGWKNGLRRAYAPDCMAQIANRMRDEDVVAVAGWLAAQAPPVPAKPAAAMPSLMGDAKAIACGSAPETGAAR